MTNVDKNKYISVFLLHALGDTIGYKNADWEFNYNKESSLDTVIEMIFEFIDLGGVNGIDLKNWIISDDTLYHMAIGKTMLKFDGKITKKFLIMAKNNLARMHNRMITEEKKGIKRYPGKTTNKYIQKFTDDVDGRTLPYDKMTGGNGAAMRNLCIGMSLYKIKDLPMLIKLSITLSKLTHNSPHGYLAGLTSAYFMSLAVRGVNINEWCFMLVNLLESDDVKQYVNVDTNDELMDYVEHINFWKKYIDTRFANKKPIKTRSTSNMIFRVKYYYENFVQNTRADFIAGSGFCAMIMAYDALIDADGNWEKLIFYAILHPGDSDTVGAIAGGLYGMLHGLQDVPKQMLCCLEEKELLMKIGEDMFAKYCL